MTTTLIAIAAGIGVAALVAGVAMMIRSPDADAIEDRLDTLAGMARKPNMATVDTSVLASPLDDMPGQLEAALSRFFNLRLLMEQADVEMSIAKFLGVCAGLASVGVVVVLVGGFPIAFAAIAAGCINWSKWRTNISPLPRCGRTTSCGISVHVEWPTRHPPTSG